MEKSDKNTNDKIDEKSNQLNHNAHENEADHHELNKDSLGLSESIIMGVAGTAPAFSISATTGIIIGIVGFYAVASLLYTGLIMFGVTLAFLHLNRLHTSAGASHTWVGQVFHPVLGFFAGWSLLVASAVFMVSGTIPAATQTLILIAPDYVNSPVAVTFTAAGWLLLVSAILIKGIKLSSYFQVISSVLELLFLGFIIIGAFWTFSSNPVEPFSFNQLSLSHFTFESFSAGALTALFFFWGWDVTVNLSEETKDSANNPGKGAIWAMIIVLLLFTSFIVAVQFSLSVKEIEAAGTNLLFVLAQKVYSSPWSYMAVMAVVLSTLGTLETTILQFTRTMFAKGRDGFLHPRYATLHKEWKTPWKATALIVGIGLVLLFFSAFFPTVEQMVSLSVRAIGYQVAFYYGLSSFACAWRFRFLACKNFKDFICLLVWPILSGIFMTFILVTCAITFDWATTAVGLGGIAIGVIPLLLNGKRRLAAK